MKLKESKPINFITKRHEFLLLEPEFTELLKAILDKRAAFRFQAKGFSMSPFIKDADVVTVSPLLDVSPRWGDIAVASHPETGQLIVHRIVGRRKELYLIKGDNIFNIDGFIPRKNILGRVVKVERNGKRVYLGFGPERILIAFLSQNKVLFPLLSLLRLFVHPILRRRST